MAKRYKDPAQAGLRESTPFKHRFKRYGRTTQLVVDSEESLAAILELDPALWTATSAPINGMSFDKKTLSIVNADGNGRIHHHEISKAVAWLLSVKNTEGAKSGPPSEINPQAINGSHPDGARILSIYEQITSPHGSTEVKIDIDTVNAIIAETESLPVSGAAGASAEKVESYRKTVSLYRAWRDAAPAVTADLDESLLGDRFNAIREKIDHFFALCAWRAAGGRPADVLQDESLGIAESSAEEIMARVKQAPLAVPDADGVFDRTKCTNAFYKDEVDFFFSGIISPLIGRRTDVLSFKEWKALTPTFDSISRWYDGKPDGADALLSAAGQDAGLLADEKQLARISTLIERAGETALDLGNLMLLQKLLLFQMHLTDLVNNFVSFPFLYSPTERAAFEEGVLVMDGRRFSFAVGVSNRDSHVAIAKNSMMFVLYAAVHEKPGVVAFEVAVPVTAGRRGNLFIGKRGIFIDNAGIERDAAITAIIENPISVSEAVFSPFLRLGRMITGKIEQITQESQRQLTSFASGDVDVLPAGASQPQAAKTAQEAKQGRSLLGGGGLLIGGSVVFAAVSAAVVYVTSALAKLTWWQFLIGLGALVLLVTIPTTILAFLKMRRRDLSSLLEACGWAVNARMYLTHRLGRFFTTKPAYPPRSTGIPGRRRKHSRRR